ncbi:unnamed protein product [Zymoseptoria tritici ST99CH_3D1]|nr:unnamed protein product [Zymoseptoria tritici ST99CH_3D1]
MNINNPLPGAAVAIPFTRAADPNQRGDVVNDDAAMRIPFARRLPNNLRNHLVAMSGEYVGTVLFLFFALGGTQVANNIPSSAGRTVAEAGSNPQQLQYIALCFGFSLAVNAWVFFRISGGLFNPAVTLGMCLIGALPWFRGALLFLVQILGGMTAAALIAAMLPGELSVQTTLGGGTSVAQGLFLEMFLTAELVFTIFMLAAEKHKSTFIAPIGIGLSLFVAELVGVYFTGGSLNPARSFGPALVNRNFHGYHWIYWLGPMLGACLAAGFYKFIKALEYETANPDQDGDGRPIEHHSEDEKTLRPSSHSNATGFAGRGLQAENHSYGDFARNTAATTSPRPAYTTQVSRAAMQSPGMSFDGVVHGGDDENNPQVNSNSDGAFGQQANYIGTHYWNTQESYFTYGAEEESPVDHDISFRPGIGADGAETFTPRTLIYDLKGAFGTLRRENALYELQHQENPAQQSQWGGNTIPLNLPPIAPSSYQQALDQGLTPPTLSTETVRFWSDYNHLFYHPRSIVQLNEYELNSDLMPFEQWSKGEELFANLDREHDLLDRDLRPFLEECDQLQGIQVLSGIDDAWGGFASKYLERVADELGKGSRWVFGLQDTQRTTRDRYALQLANVAQSLHSIDPSASMHIPLGSVPTTLPGYVILDNASRWSTSALQAAGIESLTLPTRLRRNQSAYASFDSLEATLNGDGKRRIAGCSLSITDAAVLEEQPTTNGTSDVRMTNGHSHNDDEDFEPKEKGLDVDLFPTLPHTLTSTRGQRSQRPHTFSKITTFRGAWKSPSSIHQSNEIARDRFASSSDVRTSIHQSHLLFPILSSSPQIFHFAARPSKVAIQASMATSTAIGGHIRGVEGVARRMVGLEEREALCDGLAALADEYEDGWMSEDDSEDE